MRHVFKLYNSLPGCSPSVSEFVSKCGMAVYDVVVVGAGIEGSATAYNLAKNGQKTLLVEQVNSS